MKYILKMIAATLVMVVVALPVYAIYDSWTFNYKNTKELWSEYRMVMARQLWNGFKINIY